MSKKGQHVVPSLGGWSVKKAGASRASCKSAVEGEYARLNMAFELGLDHGCARFGGGQMSGKTILILEETRYDYQKGLSDISG